MPLALSIPHRYHNGLLRPHRRYRATHTLVLVMFVVRSFPKLTSSKMLNLLQVLRNTVVRNSKVSIRTVSIWNVVVPSLTPITPLME
jgi:hypothetical protein